MKQAYLSILGSQAGAQALTLLATPWLTRLYSREEFGLFGLATTAALIASSLFSGRLEQSLHTAKNSDLHYVISRQIIFLAAFILLAPLLIGFAQWTSIANSLLILAFAMTHAFTQNSLIYLNRKQSFKQLAIVNLSLPIVFLTGTFLQSTLGFTSHVNQLLFWQAFAYLIAAILGSKYARTIPTLIVKSLFNGFNLNTVKTFIRQHLDDYRYLVTSQIFSILALNISVVGSAWLFGNATAGLLFVAQRVSRLPVSMVGNSLNEVLRSTINSEESLSRNTTFIKISIISAILGVFTVTAAWLIPTKIITWGLGSGWSDLKAVLAFTTIAGAFQLLGTSVTCLLTVYAKRAEFVINLALLISGITAVGFGYLYQTNLLTYLAVHVSLAAIIYLMAYFKARSINRSLT